MTTCPSCGIAGNNFSCPNHISCSGVNPNLDLVPPPQTSVNWVNSTSAQLFAEIGRLNVLLNERDKEIERLKGLMPPDERGPGFVGQGSWSVFAEKVVAERDALREVLAGLREKGVIDQHNRPLPLEDHHKDCGHGKDGWSLCTCDELKKADEERANKQFKDLVEEGQSLRKEFDQKTAGMRGPPQCSKCGDTGIILAHDARGMRHCVCKKYVPHDDVKVTCEHGNTECKRCGVGQPTRDPRQDLKVGDRVRFELKGHIEERQSAGIIKDYDGNDFEPVQYLIRDEWHRRVHIVPHNEITLVIGKEKE